MAEPLGRGQRPQWSRNPAAVHIPAAHQNCLWRCARDSGGGGAGDSDETAAGAHPRPSLRPPSRGAPEPGCPTRAAPLLPVLANPADKTQPSPRMALDCTLGCCRCHSEQGSLLRSSNELLVQCSATLHPASENCRRRRAWWGSRGGWCLIRKQAWPRWGAIMAPHAFAALRAVGGSAPSLRRLRMHPSHAPILSRTAYNSIPQRSFHTASVWPRSLLNPRTVCRCPQTAAAGWAAPPAAPSGRCRDRIGTTAGCILDVLLCHQTRIQACPAVPP